MTTSNKKKWEEKVDEILFDMCDKNCVMAHAEQDHAILKTVIRERVLALIANAKREVLLDIYGIPEEQRSKYVDKLVFESPLDSSNDKEV